MKHPDKTGIAANRVLIFAVICIAAAFILISTKTAKKTGLPRGYISPADRYSVRRDVVRSLHQAMGKGDYEAAALFNSILAREAFLRSYNTLKAWEGVRDPETNLVPMRIKSKEPLFWNAKDTAADLFPFLLLASHCLDRDNEHLWLLTLERERSICGPMPCKVLFRPMRIDSQSKADVIFGASEYAKDGLISVTERLGRGPWFVRMEEIAQNIIAAAYIPTSFGNICSSNTEVNGNMLQVLTRLYWATQNEEYLQMAERIGDVYLLEVFPRSNYLPAYDWDFKKGESVGSIFILRDHGNEIIPGLSELYALEKLQGRPRAKIYREPLKTFLDVILSVERTEDGLWYDNVDIDTDEAVSTRVVDNWGYILNAYQAFDLVEGTSVYQDEIQRVMLAAAARKSFPWEGISHDGYADSIESMLYLLPWYDIPQCHYWVDDEIEVMFNMQAPSGFTRENYLDGNFIRTALLYGTYKTMGVIAEPWRKDLLLGAARDRDKKTLYIYLSADKPWKGVLKFDVPRHRTIWNLPFEFPRLNEAPEWFIVGPDKKYSVGGIEKDKTLSFTGESLAQGLVVTIDKECPFLTLKVSEE
jgi:hypothetical protein